MCAFALAWRLFVLGVLFLVVGFATSHALIVHAVERGAREVDVRLAGLMGGLFAGGVAVVLAGAAMLLLARRRSARDEEPRS